MKRFAIKNPHSAQGRKPEDAESQTAHQQIPRQARNVRGWGVL